MDESADFRWHFFAGVFIGKYSILKPMRMEQETVNSRRSRRRTAPGFRNSCRSRFRLQPIQAQNPLEKSRTSLEGPFGELLRKTGVMANACPFRFSTKYQDDETDLLYYGFRYYSASTGRWLSRDPIGERGGLNAFGFVQNDPVAQADVLGLQVGSANPSPSSWTEASAVQELNGYVTQWKQQGWDYAAAGLAWFANDNHSDWNSYIYHDKVANDSGWKKAFTKQIKSEVDKLPNGNISFGEEDMKNWSEGMSFEWDHHQYFKDRFTYTFGNSVYQTMHPDNELFFALHGSHYNYYGFGCKQDAFYSVRVTILLWDPFAYPSPVGAYVDTGYDAARYLQNTWDYGRGADGRQISQYAVWIQKFSNIGQ